MPTVLSHPVPVLCLGLGLGRRIASWRLLAAGVVCSLLPDCDVISFSLGVPYADILGHRGFSHSLLFAGVIGVVAALAAPLLKARRVAAFALCGGAVAVHILLDAMTNGGLGVAAFWPWSGERVFFSWQPIEVSPFSPRSFVSQRGLTILFSELFHVWLPSIAAMLLLVLCRKAWRAR